MDKPSLLKPTLIGGAAFGLIGSIPCVNLLNVLCCSLIMGGGFVAAYLYSNDCKSLGSPFGAADGLKLGLMAGLFYWLVSSIISGIFQILMPTDIEDMIEQFEAAGMPPEALDQVEAVSEIMAGATGVLLVLGVTFMFAMVFSVIGGLIGGMVFKYEGAPPAPPAPPEPPAPPVDSTPSSPTEPE